MYVNTINLIMTLMNNLDIPPLEAVGSAGDVDHQDGVVKVNKGEGLHGDHSAIFGDCLTCHILTIKA